MIKCRNKEDQDLGYALVLPCCHSCRLRDLQNDLLRREYKLRELYELYMQVQIRIVYTEDSAFKQIRETRGKALNLPLGIVEYPTEREGFDPPLDITLCSSSWPLSKPSSRFSKCKKRFSCYVLEWFFFQRQDNIAYLYTYLLTVSRTGSGHRLT